ncbi:trehalose-phosphatase [Salinibacterium sp. SYSU T00001]|uniref:trehalose-phosphatase n=1 Tax=Homoserinimonas sedimenticola TaxID=2986805 RepID=UPI002236B73A|nr:trehalose-phosphatase [Salinibacterium sedimenticola]MCW4384958.1 trehalose-phosphatase [Salinibacterium sedimenticola]
MSGDISSGLASAIRQLARSERLLVALDFDGTLAPLVDRPEDARALPEARDAVERLAALPETRVAFISGRAMASLLEVAAPPASALLSGSHGVETRLDAEPGVELTEQERAGVLRLREILEGVAAEHPGTWVEVKPAGFALHSRGVAADVAASANASAHERVVAELPDTTERHGSNVLEFSVRSTTKGDAVRMLREFSRATAVLFAGDDVTDEDGFRALGDGDLSLKCGGGDTSAEFRVEDPSGVARVLALLAEERATQYS